MKVRDALDYLCDQHQKHKLLFESLPDKHNYMVLRDKIIRHVNLEEEVLFKNLIEMDLFREQIDSAWEDHKNLMLILKDLDSHEYNSPSWKEAFRKLKSIHELHIQEEEKEFFPEIKSQVPDDYLATMAEQMRSHAKNQEANFILYPSIPGQHEKPPVIHEQVADH